MAEFTPTLYSLPRPKYTWDPKGLSPLPCAKTPSSEEQVLDHALWPLPTLPWVVLFQQPTAYPQHPLAAGGRRHWLPAVLPDVLREVAPDHFTGPHPLQQLLRLLQAAPGPPGIGQSLLVLSQSPERPGPPVLLSSRVILETAARLHPRVSWLRAVGFGLGRVGGKNKQTKKKIHQSFVFLLRNVSFFDN